MPFATRSAGASSQSLEGDGLGFATRRKDGTLAGIHNLSEANVRKALVQGGLANPSLAVVDMNTNTHKEFGGISLIAPSSLIDRRTGNNLGTWTDDVWTPTHPTVYTTLTRKGGDVLFKMMEGIEGDKSFTRWLRSNIVSDMESGREPGMEWLYLKEKGIDATVYEHPGLDSYWSPYVEKYKSFASLQKAMSQDGELKEKAVGLVVSSEMRKRPDFDRKDDETMKEHATRLRAMRDEIRQQILDEEGNVKTEFIKPLYDKNRKAFKTNGRVENIYTVNNASRIVRDRKLTDEYEEWKKDTLERLGVERKLRDGYDRNGNARYIPATLENVSKMMNKQKMTGGGMGGWGSFIAEMAQHMNSLDDIRKNKKKLTEGGEAKMRDQFGDIAIMLHDKNHSLDLWEGKASKALANLVKNKGQIKEYAKNRYRIDLADEEVKLIEDFADDFLNTRVDYFETKFDRPVRFDEFKSAVVPQKTSQDVIEGLEKAGLTIYKYNPNREGSREKAQRKAMQDDDVRFAVKPQYTAQFVQDKEELEKRFPSSLPNKYYDHVTLKFKPGEVDTTKLGEERDVHIVGRLQTEKVDALLVESPKSSNEHPHITLATAEGVAPKESNGEIKNNLDKIVPLDEYVRTKEGASLNGMRVYKTDETHGLFGEILNDYHHDAQGAVEKLKELQSGEAVGALHHESVGDIDLVWGYEGTGKSDGFGLAKLVRYHPEVVDNLQGLLDEMEEKRRSSNRILLESDEYEASIRLDWDGNRKIWLLTEYKKDDVTNKSTDTVGNRKTDLLGNLQQTSSLADKGTTSSSSDQENPEENSIGFAVRTKPAPKVTKTAYAVFVVRKGKDGKPILSPKMLKETKIGVPAFVWLDADTGSLKRGEDGKPLQNTIGRAAVSVNGKQSGGMSGNKLSWRPGKHLAYYPNASQFMSTKDGMLDEDVVFFEVEYAADPELHKKYQYQAWEYGMKANGKYNNTLGGIPYIPEDSYYVYRTNGIADGATPMIITGSYRITKALTDAEAKKLNEEAGGKWVERRGGELTEEGLKKLGIDKEGLENLAKDFDLSKIAPHHDESDEARNLPGYVRREVNFDDPELIHALKENKQDIEEYKKDYKFENEGSFAVRKRDEVEKEVEEYLRPDNLSIPERNKRDMHDEAKEQIAGLPVSNMSDIERSMSAIEKGLSGAFYTYFDGTHLAEHPDVPDMVREAFADAEYKHEGIPEEINAKIANEREEMDSYTDEEIETDAMAKRFYNEAKENIAELEKGLFWYNSHKDEFTLAPVEFFDEDGKYVGAENVKAEPMFATRPKSKTLADKRSAVKETAKAVGLDVEEGRTRNGAKTAFEDGTTFINLDNCEDVNDVNATILHEAVKQKGLLDVVGTENYQDFVRNVWEGATPEARQDMTDYSMRAGLDYFEGIGNYLDALSRRGKTDSETWEGIRGAFIGMLGKIGINCTPKDNDIVYMLRKRRQGGDIFDAANDVVAEDMLGVGTRFAVRGDGSRKPYPNRQWKDMVDRLGESGAMIEVGQKIEEARQKYTELLNARPEGETDEELREAEKELKKQRVKARKEYDYWRDVKDVPNVMEKQADALLFRFQKFCLRGNLSIFHR